MASAELRPSLLEWTESDVNSWLSSIGFPQYEIQLRENNITGDVLVVLDPDTLKEIGVTSVGQRLSILKHIYYAKLAHNIPIEPDHYVPPSEADDKPEGLNVDKLYHIVKEQAVRLRSLEFENRRLSEDVRSYVEDVNSVRASWSRMSSDESSPLQRQASFNWNFSRSGQSPTKSNLVESPHPSPQHLEHDISRNNGPPSATLSPSPSQMLHSSGEGNTTPKPFGPSSSGSNSQMSVNGSSHSSKSQPRRQESSDNLKSFKVSLEDPAWKVLPAALKKYKINNDDWQNYAMFICYGSAGNRIERCLSYDEKPLLLFQKLKDAKKNPVFMLKHIKDIRSPIAVAQQKQAARKASETPSSGQSRGSAPTDRPSLRPPLQQAQSAVHGTNGQQSGHPQQGFLTGGNGKSGWPEAMSPAIDNKDRSEDLSSSTPSASTPEPSSQHQESGGPTMSTKEPIPSGAGPLSYAVAIYPYMAEQEDEFDVVVGDNFVIISRARGWWVVQRDPEGRGLVDTEPSKQGWVPAGCLLETKVPVSVAIEEAANATRLGSPSSPEEVSGTPILPLSILSTSFPGVALMEYRKKGDDELDLQKDDSLRVFKRYNHWSYAVKEDTGDRGWVPSWFIGKVPTANTPATPNPPAMSSNLSTPVTIDAEAGSGSGNVAGTQVSPMSSAFPPMQGRTTSAG